MDQKKIGAFIAEMRKARQLTQHDLADIIGISDKTVSRWETGRGMPEVSLIIPLCNLVSLPLNYCPAIEQVTMACPKMSVNKNPMIAN